MNNSKYNLSLLGIIVLVLIFSFYTLTTKPRFWADEAKSIELARNFLYFGRLDIQTEPGKFSLVPHILQSTGYPVTVPLAGFFKLFGYGLAQARIYMLLWMVGAILAVFYVGARWFGTQNSFLAVLLISTFASFYDSGRTVVGEIPGFLFLIPGLHFWISKNFYYWAGFWLGMAVVTKPAVYGLVIPTITLVFLLERQNFFKKTFRVAAGMMPAAIGWLILVPDNIFQLSFWRGIANFYQNPFGQSLIVENIINNLKNALYSTTLIYFGFLFLLIAAAGYRIKEEKLRSLYHFIILYSIFAFGYYLRSPGWLRYILAAELLILFSLPQAIAVASNRFKDFVSKLKLSPEKLSVGLVMGLVTIQLIHLFTSAQIFYSDSEIRVSEILNREFPDKTIGTINSLALSALLKTDKRFQVVEMTGLPIIGKSPLFLDPSPEVIAFSQNENLSKENQEILESYYLPYSQPGGYFIYLLKNNR